MPVAAPDSLRCNQRPRPTGTAAKGGSPKRFLYSALRAAYARKSFGTSSASIPS